MPNSSCKYGQFISECVPNKMDRDYKKLTFYFYAEQYINFNDLVTELFKIWKLRIWLSAVNPASYPEQKPRQTRGHRLRTEAALATAPSAAGYDTHESGYHDQNLVPASGANMMHNRYANANQLGYGNAFSHAGSYMPSQSSTYGNPYASNAENSVMTNYFGSPVPTTAMPNQQHWSSFGNYPSADYRLNSPPASSAKAGQSLAGFAGATPFVPGRPSAFGIGNPESPRNFSSRGRPLSISSMSTVTDDSAGKSRRPLHVAATNSIRPWEICSKVRRADSSKKPTSSLAYFRATSTTKPQQSFQCQSGRAATSE